MADGTAQKCGRVGSCHIYLLKPFTQSIVKGFFMYVHEQETWMKLGNAFNPTTFIFIFIIFSQKYFEIRYLSN